MATAGYRVRHRTPQIPQTLAALTASARWCSARRRGQAVRVPSKRDRKDLLESLEFLMRQKKGFQFQGSLLKTSVLSG